MRGKERQLVKLFPLLGITPAYAGKSIYDCMIVRSVWDHPRVCGEKCSFPKKVYSEWGSPPRMRGKVRTRISDKTAQRITPAYAGKRSGGWNVGTLAEDHPRVCGEKCGPCFAPPPRRGSPPRMRGKAIGHLFVDHDQRITPAYAGKSILVSTACIGCQDHPRVCGEKGFLVAFQKWH